MKNLLIASVCLGSLFATVTGASDGSALFDEGKFEDAAVTYRQQIEETGPNAELLYNLGNAYFRSDDFARAIHAYEQALVLDSSAPDIRTNLELAREHLASFDKTGEESSLVRDFAEILTFNQWGWTALFAFVAVALLVWLAIFLPRTRRSVRFRLGAIVAISCLILPIVAISLRKDEIGKAIILEKEASVRLSPFPTADVVATIPAGRVVHMGAIHNDFVHIETGWIRRGEIAPVYDWPETRNSP